jgi:hypothetical protein
VGADGAAFVLSARTVDKERVSGLWLEDRLWLLCAATRGGEGPSVVVANRGLYYEQAVALRALCPRLEALTFVTGYDKIVQIFDPRYYVDRDTALDQLFSLADFLVAPRGAATERDLATLLDQPQNRVHASRVKTLRLSDELANVSSTRARSDGDLGDVSPEVAAFVTASGCYLTPPAPQYAARDAAIRAAAAARAT